MHTNPSLLPAAPWYRHRWPWFLMIGPALVLVGGFVMIWLAMSRPDAMVVGDYYKQGKAINQELKRDRAASRLGLRFEAGYDAAGGRITGSLQSHGEPVRAPFHIRLAHPTQPERDRVLEALPDAQGRFVAAAPVLEPTHWQVVVEGAARDWRLAGSWSWNKQAQLAIAADAE
ncbi:FixH family protein [Massilia sp. IC2-476]|uniref:FixH family protein n=1 Tax=Massilia sp. IC2-476 TaxID=2887199 RepID=UPI001D12ABD0|nr:FixH family protein [Massilia sp. IC2-476]MCC2973679.1 FixH family protein [Massilia sp. IC2-476]